MRVIVTGAAGMLGTDLLPALEAAGHEAIGLARGDLDVTDRGTVESIVERMRPDAVVNCAAWTDVDGAEDAEEEARRVNADGALNVAAASAAVGAVCVQLSTDYVFDGRKGAPYVESDATAPLSAYGRSKLAGEEAAARANPRHFVVRSSWLFGMAGRNFVETMLQLAADHGEVLVVHDQVGCPTWTGHLAEGIVRLLARSDHGIHHLAGAGHCSWYEFAFEIFDQTATECQVMSATSDMLDRRAPRPAMSALETQRPDPVALAPWQHGLTGYLAERERVQGAAR